MYYSEQCNHPNAIGEQVGRTVEYECSDCGQDCTVDIEREIGSFGYRSYTLDIMLPNDLPSIFRQVERHGAYYIASHARYHQEG